METSILNSRGVTEIREPELPKNIVERRVDLAIVGGGPAGTSAALAARRHGLSVVVFERDHFPRDKVCGEFLSWEALPLLARHIPAALGRAAPIRGAEFISQRGRVFSFALPQEARGLSRRVLDAELWRSAASSGAHLSEGEAVSALRRADLGFASGWHMEKQGEAGWVSRVVILASGRWWAVDGVRSPARERTAKVGQYWLGAKAHFSGIAPRDCVEMYFFPGGYCGLAPIEDGIYNACCLVDRRLVQSAGGARFADFAGWLKLTACHEVLNARLRDAVQVSEALATAPVHPALTSQRQDCLLAGDAAAFLDPFTGDGISMALHTGIVAADCTARFCAENQGGHAAGSEVKMMREYGRRLANLRTSFRAAAMLRLIVRAPAWVQDWASVVFSRFAPQFAAGTRWNNL